MDICKFAFLFQFEKKSGTRSQPEDELKHVFKIMIDIDTRIKSIFMVENAALK